MVHKLDQKFKIMLRMWSEKIKQMFYILTIFTELSFSAIHLHCFDPAY